MNYATNVDLYVYLGVEPDALPQDSDRMLLRASEMVDYVTRGRIDTDNTTHMAAALSATVAIVEDWITNGEPVAAFSGRVQSWSAGKMSVTYAQGAGASGAGGGSSLPRRAYMALQAAGLLSAGVRVI